MAIPNRVDAELPQEDIAAIDASLNTVETKLPFLIDLTESERNSLNYLGDRNYHFVTNTLALVQHKSGFLPREFDDAGFAKDTALFVSLNTVRLELSALLRRVTDTMNVAGSEAFAAALVAYNAAKSSNVGTEGIDPYLDDLTQRFARKSKTTPPPPTT
ncbi:MAG: hypothetical protein KGJ59_12315 [Bacteroidota bacterium]|nr:hypothetical protein [Bacteroidota bacterium]